MRHVSADSRGRPQCGQLDAGAEKVSPPRAKFAAEPERYEFTASPVHRFELLRRDFFKLLGAGIAVVGAASRAAALQETTPTQGFHVEDLPKEVYAWLHIGEDGVITAFTGKVEVGQNVRTSLSQTVADELRVPLGSVRMVMGDTALSPFDAGTFGSRTTLTMTPQLRRMSAAARELLVAQAAQKWNVSAETLTAADGKVSNSAGRSFTYSELAAGNQLLHVIPAEVAVTPAASWSVAGMAVAKVDGRDFVTGRHQYTPDLSLPGMRYGKILRPPSFHATLVSLDDSAARPLAGVVVVRDGNFVGVVAPTVSAAQGAVEALRAKWTEMPQASEQTLFADLKAKSKIDARYVNQHGSLDEGFAAASHRLKNSYTTAYIAHAPLEPRAAVAKWTGEKLSVWTGTQRPFAVRDELAFVLRIPETDVHVMVPDTGSAYGGKHSGDPAVEAARLARGLPFPVKLVWTREEEFTWAYFRPAALIEVESGVTDDGLLCAWDFHNYNSGISAIETPYQVSARLQQFHPSDSPLRQGSYRGLAAVANIFARETHMDELARTAKIDPLDFRLKNLSDARLRAVFEAAAKSFGWPAKIVQPGQGFGIAGGFEKGGYVATAVELMVDPSSRNVRVVRIVTAYECGAIVNPDGLRNQVVGGIIQSLGGALFESIHFGVGRIQNPHFAQYRVPRFKDIPEIEAILLDRKDVASAGAGETPLLAVAPAIGNAIFDATGTRLTSLPLAPKGLPS
jgi:nicotinate dehydrogenase subunit B